MVAIVVAIVVVIVVEAACGVTTLRVVAEPMMVHAALEGNTLRRRDPTERTAVFATSSVARGNASLAAVAGILTI